MIRFFDVVKHFPGGQIGLDGVSLHIKPGERVFLTGPSGAGKTTLLRLIYREETPTSGQILVNGRNVATLPRAKVPYLRRSIGVVFQSFRLIQRKSVLDNVTYLPKILGVSPTERADKAREVLAQVGLAHRLSSYPQELSGGEQQRVALARALISRPEILLADEPTGNLDPDLSLDILEHLLEVQRRGTTLVIASHDGSMIESVGGRVLVLQNGRLREDVELAGTLPNRSTDEESGLAAALESGVTTVANAEQPTVDEGAMGQNAPEREQT